MAAFPRYVRPSNDNQLVVQDAKHYRRQILLVEDDHLEINFLNGVLTSAGYDLCSARTGDEALRKYQSARLELILLNLYLPDIDGNNLLRRLRNWTTAPILVMSARNDESDVIACLDLGADDYISKPFTIGELLARVRAALRRAFGGAQRGVFVTGELTLNLNRRELFLRNEQVALTATEYHLLNVLACHAGQVRTHHQLIHEVWGATRYQDATHLLRVTVSNLRRKMSGGSGHYQHHLSAIITEPGVGYRLKILQTSTAESSNHMTGTAH